MSIFYMLYSRSKTPSLNIGETHDHHHEPHRCDRVRLQPLHAILQGSAQEVVDVRSHRCDHRHAAHQHFRLRYLRRTSLSPKPPYRGLGFSKGGSMEPDPRTEREGICRITFTGATGIEWICIRDVHQPVYRAKRGETIFADTPNAAFHYFVPRWPGRPQPSERS